MQNRKQSVILHFAIPLQIVCFWASAFADEPAKLSFSRDIRPILSENCFACHGFDEASREADLRLDTFAGATSGESGSPAIVPGKSAESELIARVFSSDADLLMPPEESGKKITAAQKKMLKQWIDSGAEYENHWAFEVPRRPELPKVDKASHPIDRFVKSKLAEKNLKGSPRAPLETLIRRLSLDLIGLPPSNAEVDEFVLKASKDFDKAYAGLVERLLSSQHYGERWGRWWLDQARYADSNGYSIDGPRSIWKYRDWVVQALNDDMPFDEFTIQQIAGDLLADATEDQKIATGFHRNTQINQEGGIDKEQFRVDSVFDRVATTGTVWLGLSIGCAQCHDHKFDPITQVEYYQMFAFLNNQDEPSLTIYKPGVDGKAVAKARDETKKKLSDLFSKHESAVDQYQKDLSDEAKKKLSKNLTKALDTEKKKRNFDQKQELFKAVKESLPEEAAKDFHELSTKYSELEATLKDKVTTMIMSERKEPRKTSLLIKGDFTRPDKEVKPGTPGVLHPLKSSTENANRLDLARWIVDEKNPLTARVIVNRIWQQYFGRGITETENDFGLQGSSPTHPELLDWLATEFVARDWSVKEIHRLIVSSSTYQQSSNMRDDLLQADAGNYWLARQRRLRLDAEIVRDVALSSSGLISKKMGGPPVYPPIPDGAMHLGQVKRGWSASKDEDRYRRGIYTFKFRATPPPSLNVFDAPDGFNTCTRRVRSNTPLQALTLMNDPAFFEFAQAMEKVIENEGIASAFKRCTSRLPSDDELEILERMDSLGMARALLNLDETITRE